MTEPSLVDTYVDLLIRMESAMARAVAHLGDEHGDN